MSQHRDVGSTRRGSQQVANVAMPQRRDASTSRRLNVATPQRRDASTSRRHNVATPQRRDASTSRCLNVATPQRRDASAIYASTSLKEKGLEIEGGSENVRTRARKAEQQRPKLVEKTLTFVFSSFLKDC